MYTTCYSYVTKLILPGKRPFTTFSDSEGFGRTFKKLTKEQDNTLSGDFFVCHLTRAQN